MLVKLSQALALVAGAAYAQTPEELEAYPEYTEGFALWNTTWESIKLHTSDGYWLTMFHITGFTDVEDYQPTKPAVIFQTGMGASADLWLSTSIKPEQDPLAIAIARLGFDVYLTNNSGVQYSQEHDVYSVYDKEFWLMDWSKYGSIDIVAAVEEIQTRNGGEKVAIIGHSQGTTQAFAGMGIIPQWYDEHVSVVIQFGPCTAPTFVYFEGFYTPEFEQAMKDMDIYCFACPGWEESKQKIYDTGDEYLIGAIPTAEGLPNNAAQAVYAYGQAALSGRFQAYDPNFWDYYNETGGKYKNNPLYDFGLVQQTQVAFYVGLFDNTCPLTTSIESYNQLGDQAAKWSVFPWSGHVPWFMQNNPWFVEDIAKTIQGDFSRD